MEGRTDVDLSIEEENNTEKRDYHSFYLKTFQTMLEQGNKFNATKFLYSQGLDEESHEWRLLVKDHAKNFFQASFFKKKGHIHPIKKKYRESISKVINGAKTISQLFRTYVNLKQQKNILIRKKENQSNPSFELNMPDNLKNSTLEENTYAPYVGWPNLIFLYLARKNPNERPAYTVDQFMYFVLACKKISEITPEKSSAFMSTIRDILARDQSNFEIFHQEKPGRYLEVKLSEYFYQIEIKNNGEKKYLLDMEKVIIASDILKEMSKVRKHKKKSLAKLMCQCVDLQCEVDKLEQERNEIKTSLNLLIGDSELSQTSLASDINKLLFPGGQTVNSKQDAVVNSLLPVSTSLYSLFGDYHKRDLVETFINAPPSEAANKRQKQNDDQNEINPNALNQPINSSTSNFDPASKQEFISYLFNQEDFNQDDLTLNPIEILTPTDYIPKL